MEKIKELKVYRIVDAEYDGCQSGSNTVYICRGWACDVLRTYYRGCSIKEERILYTGTQPTSEDVLRRACNADGDGFTSWFLTSEEALEAAARLKFSHVDLQRGYLNTEQIEPLENE